jgi:hypothetical protein
MEAILQCLQVKGVSNVLSAEFAAFCDNSVIYPVKKNLQANHTSTPQIRLFKETN